MLNSLSSWPNAAPVSARAGVVAGFAEALAFSHDHRFEDAQQPVAVVGEILQDVNGAARITQDGNAIGRRHLRADEFLRRSERAQLVCRRHGRHVEVQRQQAAVLVSKLSGRFRRNAGPAELVVDLDIFGLRRGAAGAALGRLRQVPGVRRN